MADIFDEILHDTKDEKTLILFRKILPITIVSTMIIAVFISIYTWHNNKTYEHNRKIGDAFVELTTREGGDDSVNISALTDLINTSDNRQAELAELRIANKLIEEKNTVAAMEKLEGIINNKKYYDITTSFARLLWIGIILDETSLSDEIQMKSRNYLQHFANEDQAFFATATLMKSLFYKKNSQMDLAKQYARTLLNLKNASPILKEQANAVLTNL